jgi:hypothetical protein
MYKSENVKKIMQSLIGLDDAEYQEFAQAHRDFVHMRNRLAAAEFHPGQLVEFEAKGSSIRMRVKKIGSKNISGEEVSRNGKKSEFPMRWRVHVSYLTAVRGTA